MQSDDVFIKDLVIFEAHQLNISDVNCPSARQTHETTRWQIKMYIITSTCCDFQNVCLVLFATVYTFFFSLSCVVFPKVSFGLGDEVSRTEKDF